MSFLVSIGKTSVFALSLVFCLAVSPSFCLYVWGFFLCLLIFPCLSICLCTVYNCLSVGNMCWCWSVSPLSVCSFVGLLSIGYLFISLSLCLSVGCVSWCWSVSPSPGSPSYRTCRSCSTTSRPSPRSWRRPSALSMSWRCSGNGPTNR